MGRLLSVVLLTLGFTIGTTAAQENSSDISTWPIVERCLPAPILPDANWSFEGDILMWGWGGIHAVRSGIETPFVLHWGYGVISPDGQWVLSQRSRTYNEQLSGPGPLGRHSYYLGDMLVENLTTGEQKVIDWEAYYWLTSRPDLRGPAGPLWLDNERFISFYGDLARETRVANIITGEVETLNHVPLEDPDLSISPDLTRMVYDSQLYSFPEYELISENFVGNSRLQGAFWTADSAMLVDIDYDYDSNFATLTIFDRDGHLIATPFAEEEASIWLKEWSPAGNYLPISVMIGTNRPRSFILDMQTKTVIDLCIQNAQDWAWSPDGTQFAFIAGQGQQPVLVTSVEEWQPLIAAYHTGRVFGWRPNS